MTAVIDQGGMAGLLITSLGRKSLNAIDIVSADPNVMSVSLSGWLS